MSGCHAVTAFRHSQFQESGVPGGAGDGFIHVSIPPRQVYFQNANGNSYISRDSLDKGRVPITIPAPEFMQVVMDVSHNDVPA
jgi:hypothetical protein